MIIMVFILHNLYALFFSLSLSLSLCTFDYKYHFPLTDECPMKLKHHFNLVFGVVPVPDENINNLLLLCHIHSGLLTAQL